MNGPRVWINGCMIDRYGLKERASLYLTASRVHSEPTLCFGCLCIKDWLGRNRCWQGERSTCVSFRVLSTQTAVPLSILIRLILLPRLFLTLLHFNMTAAFFIPSLLSTTSVVSWRKWGSDAARFSKTFGARFRPRSSLVLLTSYYRRAAEVSGVLSHQIHPHAPP